jgi:hypothetical protein
MDNLVIFIDNGGRRSYVDRRDNIVMFVLREEERRSYKERRRVVDRRKNINQINEREPERRIRR